MKDLFVNTDQFRDWAVLARAIEDSGEIPPCTNAPDLYFPVFEGGSSTEMTLIKKMCKNQCPAVTECLIYALKHEEFGVWGGTTGRERELLRKKSRIKLSRKATSKNVI